MKVLTTLNQKQNLILIYFKIDYIDILTIMYFNPKYLNKNDNQLYDKLKKNIIINKDLYHNITSMKKQIDNIDDDKWRLIRTLITDYEFIGNNKFHNIKPLKNRYTISRAYYKLWEILSNFENDFRLQSTKQSLRFSGLAEAPGGFLQCLVDYRNNKQDDLTGISLKNSLDNKIDWLIKNKNVKIIYGDENKNHDGNLYNPEIIKHYCKYYQKKKAYLVTADGGFLVNSKEESFKGQYHNQLFLCETYISLNILQNHGHFIIKVYDICNKTIIDILTILNYCFRKIHIMKPLTSREMNNENYIICLDYKKNNNIIKELHKIIDHMWKNPNLLLNNIFKYQDDNFLNLFSNISKKKMKYQLNKLKYAISFKNKTKEELIQLVRDNHKMKSKKAYNWIEKYF